MSKRELWIGLAGIAVGIVLASGYSQFFNVWERRNCVGSNGVWNETQERCIEPREERAPR